MAYQVERPDKKPNEADTKPNPIKYLSRLLAVPFIIVGIIYLGKAYSWVLVFGYSAVFWGIVNFFKGLIGL